VPADARLLATAQLEVDEGRLTGESAPVAKGSGGGEGGEGGRLPASAALADRTNMVYAGTVVTRGTGKAVVVATGQRTEIGKTLAAAMEAQEEAGKRETILQRSVRRTVRWLTALALVLSAVGAGLGLAVGLPWDVSLLTGLSLAFATVPEEIGLIYAGTLAVGARLLSRRGVFARSTRALETLGWVDVLLTDKTGTLTLNVMRLRKVVVGGGGGGGGSSGHCAEGVRVAAAAAPLAAAPLGPAPVPARHDRWAETKAQPPPRAPTPSPLSPSPLYPLHPSAVVAAAAPTTSSPFPSPPFAALLEAWALLAEEAEDLASSSGTPTSFPRKPPLLADPYDAAVSFALPRFADAARARIVSGRGILTAFAHALDTPFDPSVKVGSRLFVSAGPSDDGPRSSAGLGPETSSWTTFLPLILPAAPPAPTRRPVQGTGEATTAAGSGEAPPPARLLRRSLVLLKGATDAVLTQCGAVLSSSSRSDDDAAAGVAVALDEPERPGGATRRDTIASDLNQLAASGLRTVAFACASWWDSGDTDGSLRSPGPSSTPPAVLLGYLAFEDEVRSEAAEAVRCCGRAGIHVVMVSGDHPLAATAVARAVGILPGSSPVVVLVPPTWERERGQGKDPPPSTTLSPLPRGLGVLPEGVLHCGEAEAAAGGEGGQWAADAVRRGFRVFARATPAHKLCLVQAFRDAGHIVAVTGDGANDAPALAGADVGVAVRDATELARQAAGVVVTRQADLSALAFTFAEGRRLADNFSTAVAFYLSAKLGLVLIFLATVLWGGGFPLNPVQIIVLELLLDVGASSSFVAEPADPDVMDRPPREPRNALLDGPMLARVAVGGLSAAGCVLAGYAYGLAHPAASGAPGESSARTFAFATWLLGHILLAMNMRTVSQPVTLARGVLENRALLAWTVAVAALAGLAGGVPSVAAFLQLEVLSAREWGVALGIAAAATCWMELAKYAVHFTSISDARCYARLAGLHRLRRRPRRPAALRGADGAAEADAEADAGADARVPLLSPASSALATALEGVPEARPPSPRRPTLFSRLVRARLRLFRRLRRGRRRAAGRARSAPAAALSASAGPLEPARRLYLDFPEDA
jgi:magnesium-transporting ATPase (P-type)